MAFKSVAIVETKKNKSSLETHLDLILSAKEMFTESLLKDIIENLPEPPNSSAVELAQHWKDEAKKRISNLSVTLLHRVQPIVQLMLEQKLAQSMDQTYGVIQRLETPLLDMIANYKICFNTWVDASHCVSFKATNTRLLGQISAKDMYILTFFAFLTCKRAKNDNILQLGMVGCSTAGKSTLFEACLMEGAHVTTNEAGVGRFQVGNKPVLMFHDIDIRTLAMSKDSEKVKTLARTEPTVTKIHSSVIALKPVFLFYSSNERLMSHTFKGPLHQPYLSQFYFSQVNDTGKKRMSQDALQAIQNRFIEAFVRSPPPLEQQHVPLSGGFQRIHAILGIFERIIQILEHYNSGDFYSPVLPQYVLQGLCVFYQHYVKMLGNDVAPLIKSLIAKFVPSELQPSMLQYL